VTHSSFHVSSGTLLGARDHAHGEPALAASSSRQGKRSLMRH
jgi:hypothetical protein